VKPFPAQTAPRSGLVWSALPLMLLLGGCSHIAGWWPWHHKSPAAPESVTVLVPAPVAMHSDSGVRVLGWQCPARGAWRTERFRSLQFTRAPRQAWPVRLEFRVLPGTARQLEVSGAQRVVFADSGQRAPITFTLPPGLYATTKTMTVSWSPEPPPKPRSRYSSSGTCVPEATCTGGASGSSRLTAVSAPPQTHPVSRPSRPGA